MEIKYGAFVMGISNGNKLGENLIGISNGLNFITQRGWKLSPSQNGETDGNLKIHIK